MVENTHDNLPQAEGEQTATNNDVNANIVNDENLEITQESTENEVVETNVETHSSLKEIEELNAEENEDTSVEEKSKIDVKNYEELSFEELTSELEKLTAEETIINVKDNVEEIRKTFFQKYINLLEEKREEFMKSQTDENSNFDFHFPIKDQFDKIYNEYKNKRNKQFVQIQKNLKNNYEVRNSLIDELKNIIDNAGEDSIGDMFKKLNDIRERWKNAGPIPRDKYNIVWNNYHFHIERFYDLIHLDKEARDQDFKYNLEQKLQIIDKAKELINEPDATKAFRELQLLHRIWKEEVGPVDREHRENVWNEFSEITKQIHSRREELFTKSKEREQQNLAVKQNILEKINQIVKLENNSHNQWQEKIKEIENLREDFFKAGRVPAEVSDEVWNNFKNAVREFNHNKNNFYKEIKNEQLDNLSKKQALVEKAKSLQDSEDFANVTPIMKQIQEDWKAIGHVPRKFSDKIWNEFKTACNTYFDKMHNARKEENKDELEAFERKKAFLQELKSFEFTGTHKADLEAIKKHIEVWKSLGRVPQNRKHIEGKFNKVLDTLFEKLSLSKKDSDLMKFNNRIGQLSENEDQRALQNESVFIRRKIDEVQSEIFQLENNIQFISNASADNPLVKEVTKSIDRHKEELKVWKEKLKQLNKL